MKKLVLFSQVLILAYVTSAYSMPRKAQSCHYSTATHPKVRPFPLFDSMDHLKLAARLAIADGNVESSRELTKSFNISELLTGTNEPAGDVLKRRVRLRLPAELRGSELIERRGDDAFVALSWVLNGQGDGQMPSPKIGPALVGVRAPFFSYDKISDVYTVEVRPNRRGTNPNPIAKLYFYYVSSTSNVSGFTINVPR